jgi:hypothetical protein
VCARYRWERKRGKLCVSGRDIRCVLGGREGGEVCDRWERERGEVCDRRERVGRCV